MSKQSFSAFDFRIMRRLLSLASYRKGATGSNPTVAAAVCLDGKIVGEGVHLGEGFPHAEVLAIREAGDLCKGATLYVTLEPCSHVGRTPACVELIIQSGFSTVIYAVDDPNPLVRRQPSKTRMEEAGITVLSGLMESEAIVLNDNFFHFHRTGQPFVTLKVGMSLDGKIAMASGESTYITSEDSRRMVHMLRREVDAILVGVGTIIQDNPSLNIRYGLLSEGFKNPRKIILDPNARTPLDSLVFEKNKDTEIIIVVREDCVGYPEVMALSEKAIVVGFPFQNGRFNLKDLMEYFMDNGLRNLLIEGGQRLYSYALEDEIVTRLLIFTAPVLLAARGAISPFERSGVEGLDGCLALNYSQIQAVGPDLMIEGYL